MNSGPCTAIVKIGKYELRCPCPKGTFLITSQSNLKSECKECKHPALEHEDSAPQTSPTELSASAYSSDYTGEDIAKRWITTCLRKDTVSKVAAVVDSENVVHIRGTPASGKTTLSELLRDYYLENHRNVFLIKRWKVLMESFDNEDHWTQFAMLLQAYFPRYKIKDFFAPKTIILIDEGQGSYRDHCFWNNIIKERKDGRGEDIKICLFCSYGSPATGLDNNKLYFTPATFAPASRITITPQAGEDAPKVGLFFTPDEFAEAVFLLTKYGHEEEFTVDDNAISYLYELTNGHPGGMKSLVNFLYYEHRHDLKHGFIRLITKDHILDDLKDDSRVFNFLEKQSVFRSFPDRESLKTPGVAEILGKVLEDGNMRFVTDNQAMELCYRSGWVHRLTVGRFNTGNVVVLPSRLHEKWIEFIIGLDMKPLPDKFNQLDKLCLAIFSEFSAINLRHAVEGKKMSTAGKYRPVEAQYQDEFYRSFNHLAGRGVPICSEWSKSGDGRVDFFIPGKKWAVELLRDHDRVDEHISRFKKGGKYYPWIEDKSVHDWIIIDCAPSLSANESSEPRLWTAVFAKDYSELKIYDYQKRPLLDIRLQNQECRTVNY
ncbi:hypothetical protein BDW62DRAFT_216167 [Aspergillus aurantiobrunneus]